MCLAHSKRWRSTGCCHSGRESCLFHCRNWGAVSPRPRRARASLTETHAHQPAVPDSCSTRMGDAWRLIPTPWGKGIEHLRLPAQLCVQRPHQPACLPPAARVRDGHVTQISQSEYLILGWAHDGDRPIRIPQASGLARDPDKPIRVHLLQHYDWFRDT